MVVLAQVFQRAADELTASVCHNFGGKVVARPVLRGNVDSVLTAIVDFIRKSVLEQQA